MSDTNDRKQKHNGREEDRSHGATHESVLEASIIHVGQLPYSFDGLPFRHTRKRTWPSTCRGYCRR